MEERRCVDDDRVVRRPSDVDERGHLALHDELRVLGPEGRGKDIEPACVPGDVARELLRIELARCDDEVVHRLRRLETEHDRRVPELKVEIEEERALLLLLGEHRGEARGDHGLARAALRREHRHDATSVRCCLQLPSRMRGLPDGEDDVVRELRQQQNVGDVHLDRGLEHRSGLRARRNENDGRARVLANGRDIIRREHGVPRCMQDAVEVATGERRRSGADLDARSDGVDLVALRERAAERVETLAVASEVDPDAIGHFAPP